MKTLILQFDPEHSECPDYVHLKRVGPKLSPSQVAIIHYLLAIGVVSDDRSQAVVIPRHKNGPK